jgi:hypothetical protein
MRAPSYGIWNSGSRTEQRRGEERRGVRGRARRGEERSWKVERDKPSLATKCRHASYS